MPIIKMPNGDNVRFPDNISPDQIDAFVSEQFPEEFKADNAALKKENRLNILQRLDKDFGERVGKANKAQAMMEQGKITAPTAFLRQGTSIAGALTDIPKELGVSAFRGVDDMTGNAISDTAAKAGKAVANTGIGKAGLQGFGKLMQGYGRFAENHPEIATNIGSAGDFVGIVPSLGGLLKGGGLAAKGAAATGRAATVSALPKMTREQIDVVKKALENGIQFNLAEATDSTALKGIDRFSTALPLSGAKKFKEKQLSNLNRGLFEEMGVGGLDKFSEQNMRAVKDYFQKAYEPFYKGKTIKVENSFIDDILPNDIEASLPADQLKQYENNVSLLVNSLEKDGTISGEKLNEVRRTIGKNAAASNRSGDALGGELKALQDKITNLYVTREGEREAFNKLQRQYKNYKTISGAIDKERFGDINPKLLQANIAKSYGDSYKTGDAGKIGDLSKAAKYLIPEAGGSDTVFKNLIAGGLTGGLGTTAAIGSIPMAAGAAAKGVVLNKLLRKTIMENPKLLQDLIKRSEKTIAKKSKKSPPKSPTFDIYSPPKD